MTPNEIISCLLAIARAAHAAHANVDARMVGDGSGRKEYSVEDSDFINLEAHLAVLDSLPGEGNGVERATVALQSFIESTGGNVAVPREVFAAAGRRVDPPQDRYAPNTIYSVATDSTGKPVIYGSRSTSAPHEDTHIMEAALEFEQAKRLRGVEVQPHKVGNLWMTTVEPITISHDFYSHRHTWRVPLQRLADNARGDDASYWQHELKAFDRTFDTLPAEQPKGLRIFISDTMRDKMVAETIIAAQKVVNDADLLNNLRRMCGYVEDGSQEPLTIGQDDATREWYLNVGYQGMGSSRRSYHSTSFHQVIRVAADTELREDEPQ